MNPNASLGHPKFAAGVFYLRQLNNYISVKASGNYTFLGYSDAYGKNLQQRERNLSFNTDVFEANVSANFNFFKFYPQVPGYRFTPYLSLGVGAINFNPYTYLGGKKYYLRPLETEGETKAYSPYALVVPVGFGLKYNLSDNINVFGELIYRFTSTGYLDDVYGTYADPNSFTQGSAASKLQDRGYVYGITHVVGSQRGNGKTDSYATLQVGVSINIDGYKCPGY